jgi:hypothetical protein
MRLFVLLLLATGCPPASTSNDDKADSGQPPDVDGDGFTGADDCDDEDGTIYVGAPELCDGLDNDCDGTVDEGAGDATTWYADVDGDGYGDPGQPVTACAQPTGYVDVAGDCDDTDDRFHPDAPEDDCNDPNDYNCDGSVGFADDDGDGVPACEDCDDTDADRFPGAIEQCNGEDDDCNGVVDDNATDASVFYEDADGDGYGSDTTITACEAPEGYAERTGDCDDTDVSFHPNAPESDCSDPNDYNCDGSSGYTDADGDGVPACQECNDADAAVFPGADEQCDGVDNNCDGEIDEATAVDAVTWYVDADGDGYGDPATSTVACDAPAGYGADSTDCDDSNADEHPGAIEVCDGDDDNCDGVVDEATAADAGTWYADTDTDGYGNPATATVSCDAPAGFVADASDCDDTDETEFPGADERCDGDDDDCDGEVDEDSAVDAATWYGDTDGDGYGDAGNALVACTAPVGFGSDARDCDDADAAIHPGADEVCNGVDDNCDGDVDENTATDALTWYADSDGDGYGDADIVLMACEQPASYSALATDCDDTDGAEYPGAAEVCDGDDDDCDGEVDEDSAVDASTWYGDTDGDGYGDAASPEIACDQPAGFVGDDTDCDDGAAGVNPGEIEVCDAADTDEDCSGLADDADPGATGMTDWYADADGDGFGDASDLLTRCDEPADYVTDATDCDDGDATEHSGAAEVCDGDDDDCDGEIDEDSAADASTWYADVDGDGYGDAASPDVACDQPAGFVADATDCDDGAAGTNPGETEVCDPLDVDEDCSGAADDADPGVTGQTTSWADVDGDGYGDVAAATVSCDVPVGNVFDATDCDDGAAGTHPGATEVCDPLDVDEDCSGLADDADPGVTGQATWYADLDGDGFGEASTATISCDAPAGYVSDDEDCDDTRASVYPGAPAVCEDGVVNDCDSTSDGCERSGSGLVTAFDEAQFVRTTASDALGFAIARVGDVDSDGYDDLFFAGYMIDSSAGADVGAAYLYRGGTTSGTEIAGTSPYAAMTGVRKNGSADYLGYQIAGAGDFDGDHTIDVFVGAPNTRAGTSSSGAGAAGEAILFTHPNSTSLTRNSPLATVRLVGVGASDNLGFDVAAGVDVNDDGLADVVAGAYGYDPASVSNAGAATVAFGGLTSGEYALTSSSVYTWTGTSTSDQLGQAVGLHPDLDGDGFGDVLVAAYKDDASGYTDNGSVYVVSGGASLPSSTAITSAADYVLAGVGNYDTFGRSLANAGDVDGDGDDDLIVGADGSNASSAYPVGTAWLFTSPISSGDTTTAYASLVGGTSQDYLGRAVDGAADFNGDGADDVIVGSTGYDTPASGSGAAFLWYGPISSGAHAAASADFVLTGTASNDAFGGQVTFAGDTNGDGFDDLLVGANNYDYGGTSKTGSVWLLLGTGD